MSLIKRALKPIEVFLALEASASILLLSCTLLAMVLANSSASETYHSFLHFKFVGLSLHHWVNDGLMTIFFFVVGMEIKREMVKGELSSPRKAALPIAGALGGMIGPALIYYFFNPAYPNSRGWGIPMATDIAFAVGVLSFFGKRVPLSLKIFLLALAIVDDLGAVLVIAFFYTKEISGPFLGLAMGLIMAMFLTKMLGVKSYFAYLFLGIGIWYCVLRSGVHATVAGVIIGFLTPINFRDSKQPLEHLVHSLHPWVSYAIMPIFAICNAGVTLSGADMGEIFSSPIFEGVGLGLLFGKPIGIILISSLFVAFGIGSLPTGTTWLHMLGVGLLAGIGFTMALFVSGLALYPDQEIYSKMGILLGSLASALAGSLVLMISLPRKTS